MKKSRFCNKIRKDLSQERKKQKRQMNEIENQKQYIEKIERINQGKALKYSILTMGCQLNENDSEKLCGMLEQMGYERTKNQKEADLALFNTCCVRENAEDKLFRKTRRIKEDKRRKRNYHSYWWLYDARKAHHR